MPVPPAETEIPSTLRFAIDVGGPLLSGFIATDGTGRLFARGRRDGEGIRVVMMNFVVEDAYGRPLFFIRQPTRGFGWSRPFQVLAPDGSMMGAVRGSGQRATLDIPGQARIEYSLSPLAWKGGRVVQANLPIASVRFEGHPLERNGAEFVLQFEPLALSRPLRRWTLAAVSFSTLASPPWEKWTSRG
ncbi:MAG TPA: hypothetical protein VEY07_08535 [Thermoplasmata archaeon]|nr:hypothetical protein [Thermoplasmata archaeon]